MPIIEPRMLGLLPDDKTKSTFWVADDSNVERRIFDTNGNLFTPDGSTVDDRLNAVGTRTYTEQNYVTDLETVTASIDKLDIKINDIVEGNLISVMNYGAVGDGIADDSTAIQNTINYVSTNNGVVYFPKGNYFIESTILLPSNIILYGVNATLISNVVEPVGLGNYSQMIFKNADVLGNENITIIGLVFDGNKYSMVQSAGAYDAVSNLILLDKVSHLVLKDCVFKNHTSNWRIANSLLPFYTFCVVGIVNCVDVEMINCQSYGNRTEGIMFVSCLDVNVDRLHAVTDTVWTPLHAWYCDNVILQNSYISEGNNEGSSLNMYSTNMRINNNQILGGGGLDIGNETSTIFNIENIVITNNTIINIGANGIYGAPSELKKNVVIKNNYIESGGIGIRLGVIEDGYIANNKIIAINDGGIGISIKESVDRIIIEGNYINASNCVFMANSRSNDVYKNIKFINNDFISNPLGELSSYSYGAGIMIKTASTHLNNSFENIKVINNVIRSEGSFILTILLATPLIAQNFEVVGNTLYSNTIPCERGVQITRFKNIFIADNNMDGFTRNTLGGENIIAKDNVFKYSLGVATAEPILLSGTPTGYGEVTKNISYDETKTIVRGAHNFTKYRIQDNIPNIYYSDVKNSSYGTTADRPVNPDRYQYFYDKTLNKPIIYNDATLNWQDMTGTIS